MSILSTIYENLYYTLIYENRYMYFLKGLLNTLIMAFFAVIIGLILKIHELEHESGFFSLLMDNILSKQIKIDTCFKENIGIVMQVIHHILEKLFCGDYLSFSKSFVIDKTRMIECYQNINSMYKNFQLYNLDKESFLNYVFNEIKKITI